MKWNYQNSAVSLHFINSIIQASSFVFVNALFLSTYPASWLGWFFIGQSVIDVIVSYLLAPLFTKNSSTYPAAILFVTAIITGVFCYLTQLHWFYLPLIFSFFIMSAGLLSNIISWNSVRSAFDLIEFKEISSMITTASSISSIIGSIFIALLVKRYNIQFLPYVIGILMLLSAYCSYLLKPLPVVMSSSTHNSTVPLRYPLYRKVFITVLLVAVSYTLIDYCLKFKLTNEFNSSEIGEFMAIFIGIANLVSFFFSLIGIKFFVSHFGVSSLLFTLPVYWAVTSALAVFFPSLLPIAVMAAGKYIFYYSIFSTGRELVLNVLPNMIRVTGQFMIKSIASPLGAGIASIFLLFWAPYLPISIIVMMVIVINIILLISIRTIQSTYVATLKDAIQLKRFNISDDMAGENLEVIKSVAVQSLASNSYENIALGFALLSHIKLSALPKEVIRHIDSEHPDIRIQAIQNIARYPTSDSASHLLLRFEKENDPDVKWWLLNSVAGLHSRIALALGRGLLTDPVAEVRAGAVRLLLSEGNLSDEAHAFESLQNMLTDSDINIRRNAARVLRFVTTGNIVDELRSLIADQDNTVSSYAMEAAAANQKTELGLAIIDRVLHGGVYFAAQKALIAMGNDAIPLLIENIKSKKHRTNSNLKFLISILASIPGAEVERQLLHIAKKSDPAINNILVKEFVYRVQRMPLSQDHHELIKEIIIEEAARISALKTIQLRYVSSYDEGMRQLKIRYAVYREIEARLFEAKHRILLWMAIFSNPKVVFGLLPVILNSQSKVEQSKAIELLISTVHKEEMTKVIMNVFYGRPAYFLSEKFVPPERYLDEWLTLVIKFAEHQEAVSYMDNMQKVFVLRGVELFKQLSGELLLIIASEAEVREVVKDEVIFAEGDPPTGIYIIASGDIEIRKHGKILNTLKEGSFFGELALLDDAKRAATAVVKSDGVLLFLEKETFNRIADDQPEVLRAVLRVVLQYLRQSFANPESVS